MAIWRKYTDALGGILRDSLTDKRLTFGTQSARGNAAVLSLDEWLENPAATGLDVRVHLLAADVVRTKREELIADVSRTFQTPYPLVLVATSDEPLSAIRAFLEPEVDVALERRPEYTLDSMAAETLVPEDELERWENSLDRKKQVILYGPPGTGKTFLARRLANHVVGGTDGFTDLVQFHPSYSYEDFLQGIRPRTTVEGGLTYALQDGTFKRFCDRARARTGPCVLVIDEINRANLSRVFGELMYLLEYRGDEIPVAYGGTFGIPDNVFIIATMNTADRSIALVDHALRRRFAFIRLAPNYEILRRFLQNGGYQPDGMIEVLKEVNSEIRDEDYHLGISFFLTAELPEHIEDIWCMEIEPYLEEYFFDQRDKLSRFRWDAIKGRVAV